MPKILIERKGNCLRGKKKVEKTFVLQRRSNKSGSVRIGIAAATFFTICATVLLGAFYLYQVNGIATQGFDAKKMESRIFDLKKENQKLKIREMEVKSMRNIEKSARDLNLVNSPDVSYAEISGPVAMR